MQNAPAKILLVDDTPANLDVLCALLEKEGHEISMAPNGPIALKIAGQINPELILLDIVMPDMDGYEVCRRLKADPQTQAIPIIFITANDQTQSIVAGFAAGGVDYIIKPFRGEEVLMRAQTHLNLSRLTRELEEKNRALEEEITQRKALKGRLNQISEREAAHWGLEGFIGRSPTMQRISSEILELQKKSASTVLIVGEPGTGKELVARAIHYGSPRKEGPFIAFNCPDLPRNVIESLDQRTTALSMLFGHVQGAFASAVEDKNGCFQMAHGGTLFLDEIGKIPLPLQSHILRVLQRQEVRRVGERDGRILDLRIIASAALNLDQLVEQGEFNRDLYNYLAQFYVQVPPLRDRPQDIPLLAQHFLNLFLSEMSQEVPALSTEVLTRLQEYHYPGNVRELKNIIERALIESEGFIGPEHLHFGPISAA